MESVFLLSVAYFLIFVNSVAIVSLYIEVKSSLKSTHQVTMVGAKQKDVKFEKLDPEMFEEDYGNIN